MFTLAAISKQTTSKQSVQQLIVLKDHALEIDIVFMDHPKTTVSCPFVIISSHSSAI